MTRKRLILATMGLIALLSMAVTGLIYAGPLGQGDTTDDPPITDHGEELQKILQDKEGDDTVLATVNGLDFTTQGLRTAYQSHMLTDPSLTKSEAIKAVILSTFDNVLLTSIAQTKDITTTETEAKTLVNQARSNCETDEAAKADCVSVLASVGLDYEQYWKDMVSAYQEHQTTLKTLSALRDEYTSSNNTTADGEDLDWLAIHDIRENASVVWNDKEIKSIFDKAHTDRGKHLDQYD